MCDTIPAQARVSAGSKLNRSEAISKNGHFISWKYSFIERLLVMIMYILDRIPSEKERRKEFETLYSDRSFTISIPSFLQGKDCLFD